MQRVPLAAMSRQGGACADWIDGRVGDWLRHYRPDLADEAARQLKK
ncbi:hypothetical protein [Leucobacter tenebrionis]|nr:hypothetical protein [Leucobacter tenebrionis]QZY52387.1 hypothetical protein KVY00_02660 [Leucobacter tenebrionis]